MGGMDNAASRAAADEAEKNQKTGAFAPASENPLNTVGPGSVRRDFSAAGLARAEQEKARAAKEKAATSDRAPGLLSAGTDAGRAVLGPTAAARRRAQLLGDTAAEPPATRMSAAPAPPTQKRRFLGTDGWEVEAPATPQPLADEEARPRAKRNLLDGPVTFQSTPTTPSTPSTSAPARAKRNLLDPVASGALNTPNRGMLEQVKNARAIRAAAEDRFKNVRPARKPTRRLLALDGPARKPGPSSRSSCLRTCRRR